MDFHADLNVVNGRVDTVMRRHSSRSDVSRLACTGPSHSQGEQGFKEQPSLANQQTPHTPSGPSPPCANTGNARVG